MERGSLSSVGLSDSDTHRSSSVTKGGPPSAEGQARPNERQLPAAQGAEGHSSRPGAEDKSRRRKQPQEAGAAAQEEEASPVPIPAEGQASCQVGDEACTRARHERREAIARLSAQASRWTGHRHLEAAESSDESGATAGRGCEGQAPAFPPEFSAWLRNFVRREASKQAQKKSRHSRRSHSRRHKTVGDLFSSSSSPSSSPALGSPEKDRAGAKGARVKSRARHFEEGSADRHYKMAPGAGKAHKKQATDRPQPIKRARRDISLTEQNSSDLGVERSRFPWPTQAWKRDNSLMRGSYQWMKLQHPQNYSHLKTLQ